MNVLESMKGFAMYHCLYVGVKTGIFEYINRADNKKVNTSEISDKLHLHPEYVDIWFNTALAFGVLEYKSDIYLVKKEFEPFLLDKNDVRYQGDLIRIFVDHLSVDMRKQPEFMLSGNEYLFSDHSHEFVELISKRGYLRSKTFIENFLKQNAIIESVFLNKSKIVDVGCGSGSFLQGLNDCYPLPNYFGVDEDEKSVEIAKKIDGDNIKFILGRIEDTELGNDIDCIIMVLALHEINDSNRINVLEKCYSRLSAGGYLLIMEFPYPEDPSEFSDNKYLMGTLDQYFEMIWGTKHIGWSEQESIIRKAGFENINRLFLEDGIYMVISSRKPLDK